MRPVYINGRFLSQAITGVQRYAREIVKALDATLSGNHTRSDRRMVLVMPPNASELAGLRTIESRRYGVLRGQAWEQLELPRYTRDGVCLNLCNTGPLAARSLVVTIHDAGVFAVPQAYSWAFRRWYRLLHPQLGRRARCVLTVSEFSRSELTNRLGISPALIRIISNGGEHILAQPADRRVLDRLGIAGPYLLAVSSQSRHKNFGGVLAAFELLRRRDLMLVFAGGTNSRIFARNAAASARARMAGRVSDGELRALYENAECFVYPSFYEGFGLPPLEAMTCGCPVVVSRAASLPEVCGEAAVYCDPGDPADIARALQRVLDSPKLRAELRLEGRRQASGFSWSQAAQSLVALLDELPTQ